MAIDGALLARVLDVVPIAVLVERAGRIIYANRASLTLLAASHESLCTESILDRVADGALRTELAELLDGRFGTLSGVPLRSNGGTLTCDIATYAVTWGRGRAATITLHLDGHAGRPCGGAGLTPREWEIAQLLAAGHSVLGAASQLGCSESTIRTHLKAVYRKTGCHSRVELAHLVVGLGPR